MSSGLSSCMCLSSLLLAVDKATAAYFLRDGRELFQRRLQILNNTWPPGHRAMAVYWHSPGFGRAMSGCTAIGRFDCPFCERLSPAKIGYFSVFVYIVSLECYNLYNELSLWKDLLAIYGFPTNIRIALGMAIILGILSRLSG
jgi:hypothetical protein